MDRKALGPGRFECSQGSLASSFTSRPQGNDASGSIWIKSSYFIFLRNGDSLKGTRSFPLHSHYSEEARCWVQPIIRYLGVEMSFFPPWMIDDAKRLGCHQEHLKCLRISSPPYLGLWCLNSLLVWYQKDAPVLPQVGEPRDWVLDRGLMRPPLAPPQGSRGSVGVGGLQSYLKDQRNGPNDQKSVVFQIWWSWFCFLPHVSLASSRERNRDGIIVRMILTTLYHARALHWAHDELFYFISMAASPWGRSYWPILQKRKVRLGNVKQCVHNT